MHAKMASCSLTGMVLIILCSCMVSGIRGTLPMKENKNNKKIGGEVRKADDMLFRWGGPGKSWNWHYGNGWSFRRSYSFGKNGGSGFGWPEIKRRDKGKEEDCVGKGGGGGGTGGGIGSGVGEGGGFGGGGGAGGGAGAGGGMGGGVGGARGGGNSIDGGSGKGGSKQKKDHQRHHQGGKNDANGRTAGGSGDGGDQPNARKKEKEKQIP